MSERKSQTDDGRTEMPQPTSAKPSDEQHEVSVELTDAVDKCWFAEQFSTGERFALQLGSETNVAEVIAVEPAEGVIAVDLSDFDRTDLGRSVALPDRSSTGMQTANLGVLWSIESVPVDSTVAHDDSVDQVICDCGTLCQSGRGHSVHQTHSHSEEKHADTDSSESVSETKSQTDDGRTELPHPSDDPDLRYTHVGKQFEVCGSDVTFEIVDRDTSILPQADGIIIIESESKMIRSEHESDRSGVSQSALAPYEPEAENKAVWTVQGHINAFRNLRIAETDAWSYEDMFWNAQEDDQ